MSLDPKILMNLIPKYQSALDLLINTMGKSIRLHFKSIVTNVESDLDDQIRLNEERKPSYKATIKPTVIENTKDIIVLIRHAPKDYKNFGIRIDFPQNLIRIKSFLTDSADLQKCEYISIDNDPNAILNGKYKAIRVPVPIGLGISRYAISYWERV